MHTGDTTPILGWVSRRFDVKRAVADAGLARAAEGARRCCAPRIECWSAVAQGRFLATIYVRSVMLVFAVALTAVLSRSLRPVARPVLRRRLVARDWMDADDPLAARVRPGDCATVEQSPPDFGWPQLHDLARYEMTLHLSRTGARAACRPRTTG